MHDERHERMVCRSDSGRHTATVNGADRGRLAFLLLVSAVQAAIAVWALTWFAGALEGHDYGVAVVYLLLFMLLGSFTAFVTYRRLKQFRAGTYMRKGGSIWRP